MTTVLETATEIKTRRSIWSLHKRNRIKINLIWFDAIQQVFYGKAYKEKCQQLSIVVKMTWTGITSDTDESYFINRNMNTWWLLQYIERKYVAFIQMLRKKTMIQNILEKNKNAFSKGTKWSIGLMCCQI